MSKNRSTNSRVYTRSMVSIGMLVTWSLSALTGLLLWAAPTGQRSGRVLLLGISKSDWGDLHTWLSFAALIITIIHLFVDWKGLKGSIKYLINNTPESLSK